MKLATFEVCTPVGGITRIGALIDGDRLIDLNAGYALYLKEMRKLPKPREEANVWVPADMLGFLEGEEYSMEQARITIDYVRSLPEDKCGLDGQKIVYALGEVKLRAPVLRPPVMADCSCYDSHLSEQYLAHHGKPLPEFWYEKATWYRQNPTTVVGTEETIYAPDYSSEVRFDFEGEIGVFIGKKGYNLSDEEAKAYIAGYTIYNDVSERAVAEHEMPLELGPSKGKEFEHSNVIGPFLVTPDEIDYDSLSMTVRVNGVQVAHSSTAGMYHTFNRVIASMSRCKVVYPGDFIGSGTIGHCTGMDRSTNVTLKPGDVVELEVPGIGILKNRVAPISEFCIKA